MCSGDQGSSAAGGTQCLLSLWIAFEVRHWSAVWRHGAEPLGKALATSPSESLVLALPAPVCRAWSLKPVVMVTDKENEVMMCFVFLNHEIDK